jgi:hypothetical protein
MGHGFSLLFFFLYVSLALFPHVSRCRAFHGPIACTKVLFFPYPAAVFTLLSFFPDIAFGSSFDCLLRLEDRGWFSHGLMYVKTSLP